MATLLRPPPQLPVTIADIEAARIAIAGAVLRTPTLFSRTLSAITGANLWFKFENLQFTASFKERGALNRLAVLTPDERARGVVAASAGNHAQGVAYNARRLGIPATIVMPRFTPTVKVRQTEEHGATVSWWAIRWKTPSSTRMAWSRRAASRSSTPMTTRG